MCDFPNLVRITEVRAEDGRVQYRAFYRGYEATRDRPLEANLAAVALYDAAQEEGAFRGT